jgi:hypothetical protein
MEKLPHYTFPGESVSKNGDIIYVSSVWEDVRQEDEEEDVGGCWMALVMGGGVLI